MRNFIQALVCIFFIYPSLVSAQDDNLTIGALLCLTGNCSDWGNAALEGAQLAAEELNQKGGVLNKKLVLKVEDTAEAISGAKAVTAFKKLISLNDLNFIIGPSWSPGARSLVPLVKERKDLLIITPSASAKDFTEAGNHIFNMRAAEEDATKALAEYAYSKGWKKAAIFSSQQPAEMTQGRVFDEEFRKLGGIVTIRLEPPPTLTDLRSETTKIVSTKPDVIFLMNYNQLNVAARELTKQGFSGGRLAISLDKHRIVAAQGALDELVIARSPGATPEFLKAFNSKYGHAPGLSAEGGYDAIRALALSIEQVGSLEISEIAKVISKLEFYGASGQVAFNNSGEMIQKPVLLKVVGEQLVPINDS